jgi:hypothetical protein
MEDRSGHGRVKPVSSWVIIIGAKWYSQSFAFTHHYTAVSVSTKRLSCYNLGQIRDMDDSILTYIFRLTLSLLAASRKCLRQKMSSAVDLISTTRDGWKAACSIWPETPTISHPYRSGCTPLSCKTRQETLFFHLSRKSLPHTPLGKLIWNAFRVVVRQVNH